MSVRNKSIRRRLGGYKVGKGRPPVATRWKPGQSGNPHGRPKGSRNIATIFDEALDQKITMRDRGRARKVTVWDAIVRTLINEAVNGNVKAIEFLLAKEPEIVRKTKPVKLITRGMSVREAMDIYMETIRRDRQ